MSSSCDVRFEWDKLRDWVLRSSFPTLLHEVRADVVRHLAKGDDTLYSISKAIGHPIQSVMKALKALTERGYVVCERRESTRRKGVEANVCGLTELGRLAALALLDHAELEIPLQEESIYSGLFKIFSDLWLKNEKLKNIYREALMIVLAKTNLENNYQNILRYSCNQVVRYIHTFTVKATAAQAKAVVFDFYAETLRRKVGKSKEDETIPFLFKSTVFEIVLKPLYEKLRMLGECDDNIRRILLETAREYVKSEIFLIFHDYATRLLFLESFETKEKWKKISELIDELISINEKIYEELGLI